ncbi:hypothetical protein K438DRAFT_1771659 [Mycena galopus ATCC 62051]|nr:hypothetical protein K438DRAFT_1771659 [Mycena galopus ATCC 62051]
MSGNPEVMPKSEVESDKHFIVIAEPKGRIKSDKSRSIPEKTGTLSRKGTEMNGQFARHCQCLRTLELMFNPSIRPPPPEDEGVVQTSLRELRISFSPISDSDTASVAGYLFHLFPNITTLFYQPNHVLPILPDPNDRWRRRVGQHSPDRPGWIGVAGHLQAMHEAKSG